MFERKNSIDGRLVYQLHAILRSNYMKAQEKEITYRERLVEQRCQHHPRFAFILALLSLPLIIVGICLLIFAGVRIAGVTLLVLTILLLVLAACRRERNRGHPSRYASARVLHSTGWGD